MIPPEYWRQMYEELSRIDWELFRTNADKARERAHERLAAEYDAAIIRNQKAKKNANAVKRYNSKKEYMRQWQKEHRAELAAYNRERRKRRKAEQAAQENPKDNPKN